MPNTRCPMVSARAYRNALNRLATIERLPLGSPELDVLEALLDVIEAYEQQHPGAGDAHSAGA